MILFFAPSFTLFHCAPKRKKTYQWEGRKREEESVPISSSVGCFFCTFFKYFFLLYLGCKDSPENQEKREKRSTGQVGYTRKESEEAAYGCIFPMKFQLLVSLDFVFFHPALLLFFHISVLSYDLHRYTTSQGRYTVVLLFFTSNLHHHRDDRGTYIPPPCPPLGSVRSFS